MSNLNENFVDVTNSVYDYTFLKTPSLDQTTLRSTELDKFYLMSEAHIGQQFRLSNVQTTPKRYFNDTRC